MRIGLSGRQAAECVDWFGKEVVARAVSSRRWVGEMKMDPRVRVAPARRSADASRACTPRVPCQPELDSPGFEPMEALLSSSTNTVRVLIDQKLPKYTEYISLLIDLTFFDAEQAQPLRIVKPATAGS
jgi:hypothetical protein